MNSKLILAAIIGGLSVANADEKCAIKMQNAASFRFAQEQYAPVQNTRILSVIPGAWTEMVGNNTGSSLVGVYINSKKFGHYQVNAKQVGVTDNCEITKVMYVDDSNISPEIRQAEKYKLAIRDTTHMSESDSEWSVFVSSSKVDANFSEASLRKALNAGDEEISRWTPKEAIAFLDDYAENRDVDGSYRYKTLKETMLKDFEKIYIFKVGKPDSGELKLHLVGRTSEGYLVGLTAITVET